MAVEIVAWMVGLSEVLLAAWTILIMAEPVAAMKAVEWVERMAAWKVGHLGCLTIGTMVGTLVETRGDLKAALSVAGMVLKKAGVMADSSAVMTVGEAAVELVGSWGTMWVGRMAG